MWAGNSEAATEMRASIPKEPVDVPFGVSRIVDAYSGPEFLAIRVPCGC